MNILLCTLGATWAVVPEIVGFVAPGIVDLYAHHPQRVELDALRAQQQLQAPDEIWICTTEGEQTQKSLRALNDWWQQLNAPLPLRIYSAAGTNQLANQAECEHLRELIFRAVLQASEACAGGQLLLSLAGGRKTMSADLQSAGMLFGTTTMLHVIGPEPLPAGLTREATPKTFSRPLPADLAQAITPLIVGNARRDDLLDVTLDGQTVNSRRFPLPPAEPDCAWPMCATKPSLVEDIQQRQRQGSRLFGNFIHTLANAERHENWRSLYRLPPAQIEQLRTTQLATQHQNWLINLPKADLHRHLGGSLRLSTQIDIGRAVWESLSHSEQDEATRTIAPLLNTSKNNDWPWHWPASLHKSRHRAAASAALLTQATPWQLERNLYGVTEPRLALKTKHLYGFAAYERPGELTGSAILTHPAALAPYARALVEQARSEGLAYLELRGSPHKYRPENPTQFVADLAQALKQAGANTAQLNAPIIRFIWILDRRQPETLAEVVAQAVSAYQAHPDFLVGLDLAGDENNPVGEPEKLAPAFIPAFRECLPITIHAGEGESAEKIWQAAYHLHADRIGHGLSIAEHEQLATRFRNRGIALELCPTSNREVVGFYDPAFPASSKLPRYPLRRFLELGLPVSLSTDNPGISHTTLADEYLTAARMTGQLSQWETLALIKQSFTHAFLNTADREALLKQIDQVIFEQLTTVSITGKLATPSPGAKTR